MQTEYELKILEIDPNDIISKLDKLWAQKLKNKFQKRFVYDFVPQKSNSWIRLRTDGELTTLTIKQINNDNIDWTKELEITVDDFLKTNEFLKKLWYVFRSYQENKRISYILDDVQIEIDTWPNIPTYLEIESDSSDKIKKIVTKLWFDLSQTTSINTKKIYQKYWINIDSVKYLKF